jgi:Tfp pilus assembly pilus retraction ATPase PilT
MFTGVKEGMQALEFSLASLVKSGIVTFEDALSVTTHPKELARSLEQMGVVKQKK